MQSRYAEIKSTGAELIGVSVDTVEENLALATKAQMDFALLSDADGKMIGGFGVRHAGAAMDGGDIARPAVFIINEDGKIVWRAVTDNYRIRIRPETIIEQLEAL